MSHIRSRAPPAIVQQPHRAAGSLNHLKRARLKLGGAEKSTPYDLKRLQTDQVARVGLRLRP